jgi:hypothetical protein
MECIEMFGRIKFISWVKVLSVISFVSTFVGIAFQKGAIESMGFGNLSGSYQIQEVVASAIYAYLILGNLILEISVWKILIGTIFVVLVFPFMGVVFWVLKTYEEKIERLKQPIKNYFKPRSDSESHSMSKTAILMSFVGLIPWIGTGMVKYVLVFFIGITLLPVYASHALGQRYIEKLSANDPCVPISAKTKITSIVHQCTQLTIKGKKLSGRMIYERNDGYFFQVDNAYIFVQKNGDGCIYSGFLRKSEMENIDIQNLSFENSEIENLCVHSFSRKLTKV